MKCWLFRFGVFQTAYVIWKHADSPYLHIWCWKTLKTWILARWTRSPENWAWHRTAKMYLFVQVFLPNILWCIRQMILALLLMLPVKWTALFPGRYYSYALVAFLVSYKKDECISLLLYMYLSVLCVNITLITSDAQCRTSSGCRQLPRCRS